MKAPVCLRLYVPPSQPRFLPLLLPWRRSMVFNSMESHLIHGIQLSVSLRLSSGWTEKSSWRNSWQPCDNNRCAVEGLIGSSAPKSQGRYRTFLSWSIGYNIFGYLVTSAVYQPPPPSGERRPVPSPPPARRHTRRRAASTITSWKRHASSSTRGS